MNKRYKVVLHFEPGSWEFYHRWEAVVFAWTLRRSSGWSHWDFISEEERAKAISLKPHYSWFPKLTIKWRGRRWNIG